MSLLLALFLSLTPTPYVRVFEAYRDGEPYLFTAESLRLGDTDIFIDADRPPDGY